jgi:inner membrane protein
VGAALAELALRPGRDEAAGARRLFLAAGVIASNLPDLDLVYTGIAPAPLGYLLHHRGHTHTFAGLAAQGLVMAAVCLAPPLRRAIRSAGLWRFAALVAVSLGLHIGLDSWNTYGVHPFWPLDSRWSYGDAVFIFEPWLWLLLGLGAAMNARSRPGGIAMAVVVVALFSALTAAGILPVPALVALLSCGALMAWGSRAMPSRVRATAALAMSAVFVSALFGLSAVARGRTGAALGADREVVELIVNPNPGWPLCWDVIALQKEGDDLLLRRGTLSLLPGVWTPDRCPSHRLERRGPAPVGAAMAWGGELRQPLGAIRDLAQRDCFVRSWLQFGRAPFIRDATIADLRFDSGSRGNFTAMAIPGGNRACPPALTDWALPRADVLAVP